MGGQLSAYMPGEIQAFCQTSLRQQGGSQDLCHLDGSPPQILSFEIRSVDLTGMRYRALIIPGNIASVSQMEQNPVGFDVIPPGFRQHVFCPGKIRRIFFRQQGRHHTARFDIITRAARISQLSEC